MTVPKETIWQDLRSDCLDAIPVGSYLNAARPMNLASWQDRGYYAIRGSTSKRFELVVPADDFGSALLTDAELLLDGAAEHQVCMRRHIQFQHWLSPAWLGVTCYYWSYYLALALTRLIGRTVWFVTKDVARNLKTLASPAPASPGAGCYRVLCGKYVSATERELILEKTNSRVHDELWTLWFSDCSSMLAKSGSTAGLSDEARLYTALDRSARILGTSWPSAFRNVINYHPGFAYTAVRRVQVLKSFSYLRKPDTYDFLEVVDRFETAVVKVKSPASLFSHPQIVLEMLVDLTFLLLGLATDLHAELLDRHRIDGRWRDGRLRFLKTEKMDSKDGLWPL